MMMVMVVVVVVEVSEVVCGGEIGSGETYSTCRKPCKGRLAIRIRKPRGREPMCDENSRSRHEFLAKSTTISSA